MSREDRKVNFSWMEGSYEYEIVFLAVYLFWHIMLHTNALP